MERSQETVNSALRIQQFGPVPLYLQVSDAIRQAIESGEFRSGQELPSEGQLCDIYGVSRITVRQAIAELLTDGTVSRKRSRGPLTINPPRILREVTQLSGPFVDSILGSNLRRRTELLSATVEQAPHYATERLGLHTGTPAHRLDFLHLGDDEPLCRQVSWIPEYLVPGLLDHVPDLTRGSLRYVFESYYGLPYARKLQRISARSATVEEAALLQIDRRAAILELERTILIADGRAIELVLYALRADRFTIVSDLGAPPELAKTTGASLASRG